MENALGSLNPSRHGALRRGMHKVSLKVLLDLEKKPFLSANETAKALELHAAQAGFDARGEAHSRENAYKKANEDLAAFARGELSEVPEDAAHLAERYYSIQAAVRYAHADWVKDSGIAEFCAPILQRAAEQAQAKLTRALDREDKVAQALQIPFEPSESALAIHRTAEELQHAHRRVAQFVGDASQHDISQPLRIRHLLADLLEWPTA